MISIDFKTGKTTSNVTTIWTGTGGQVITMSLEFPILVSSNTRPPGQAPEGPHFYFKNGYYYLMIAEGTKIPEELASANIHLNALSP